MRLKLNFKQQAQISICHPLHGDEQNKEGFCCVSEVAVNW